MNSYTIDECVDLINARLAKEGLPATMNVRLLRHYQVQRSIDAPVQEGRFAKYSDKHVEDIVALRQAQDLGFSSKAYTAISNIQKQADLQGVANTLDVGALYASTAPARLSANTTGPVGAMANVGPNTSLDASLFAANIGMPVASSLSTASTASASSVPTDTSDPNDTNKKRQAALHALAGLGGATLERTVPSVLRSAQAPIKAAPVALHAQQMTEWQLPNGVRVQAPSSLHATQPLAKRQAFEAWLSQMPLFP